MEKLKELHIKALATLSQIEAIIKDIDSKEDHIAKTDRLEKKLNAPVANTDYLLPVIESEKDKKDHLKIKYIEQLTRLATLTSQLK